MSGVAFTTLRAACAALWLCMVLPAAGQEGGMSSIADPGYSWSRSWVDVNSDGRDDYCVFTGGSAETLDCWLTTTAGPGATRATYSIGGYTNTNPFQWVDVNGDGRIDLCRLSGVPSFHPTVTVACRLGPAFSASVSVNLPSYSSTIDGGGTETVTYGIYDGRDLFFADVDADGRTDLCYFYTTSPGFPTSKELRCHLSTGTSFSAPGATWIRTIDPGETDWPRGFHDFDGDGFPDYCRVRSSGTLRCLPGGQAGFGAEVTSTTLETPQHREGAGFVDVNGDGKTDFCRLVGSSGAYRLGCRLSNGKAWESSHRMSAGLAEVGFAHARWWVDINGDALPDFCRAVGTDPGTGSGNAQSTLSCRLARAGDDPSTGLFALADARISANFGRGDGGRAFCDPWGTGIATFCRATYATAPGDPVCTEGHSGPICYTPLDQTHGIHVGLLSNMQARQPLLEAYTDGLGAETRITYKALTDAQVYARSGFGETPRVSIALPRSLVVFESRAWRTDSDVTLTGTARYFYKDLRIDNEQGSRGFRERWLLTEGGNSLEHTIYYQGLGPTVDAGSLLNDPREIGQIREHKRYAIGSGLFIAPSSPPGMNPRQGYLAAVMLGASAAGGMPTAPSGSVDPFMLLQRTVNTLGDTTPANLRLRFPKTSQAQSWDWIDHINSVTMPVTDSSTVMSDYGNIESLVQTTTHAGKVWKKATTNTYNDNIPAWLLGRLTRAHVVSEAPSMADQLALYAQSYGTSPNANSLSSSNPPVGALAAPAFNNTQVGQTATATATLSNSSGSALAVVPPSTSSVTGASFRFVSTTCGISLADGATCGVVIEFEPTTATRYPGSVVVDTGAGPRTAAFEATSLATLSVAKLVNAAPSLSGVWVGAAEPTDTAQFRNDGNVAMTLTGLSGISAPFRVSANNCTSIAPAATCTMTIAMATTAAGAGPDAVTTAGATTNASFSINGTVSSSVSRWSTTSVAFGAVIVGASSFRDVTLYNDGFGASVNWSGALFNLPAGYSADRGACAAVPPGGNCNVRITFAPTAAQSYSGSGIRPSPVTSSTNTLAVSGSGVVPPSLAISPTSHAFGSTMDNELKSATFTVTNSGGAGTFSKALAVSNGGNYAFGSGTCPANGATLGASASCTIVVTYRGALQCGGQIVMRNATLTATAGSSSASAALSAANYVHAINDLPCR